jgi:5-methylcytosine-specific restriction endonuclease McrA
MPLAVLPEKNTFLHFEEDVNDMTRSATCPGNYVPLTRASSDVWTPPAASSLDADCMGNSPHNLVPLEVPALMLPSSASDAADTNTLQRTKTVSGSQFMSSQAPWSRIRETDIQVWPATPSTVAGSPHISDEEPLEEPAVAASNEKKRWADLSEDEADPVCSPESFSPEFASPRGQSSCEIGGEAYSLCEEKLVSATLEADNEIVEKKIDTGLRRPQFSRPTRERRTRQLRTKLDECFKLDFDAVDPSQQDGLTHRMLVTLKSLAESISFWTHTGEQVTEEAFHLLELTEDDMYGIGRIIRKADKLLQQRCFRDAYDQLRTACKWFNPETLKEERSKAHAHAERRVARTSRSNEEQSLNNDQDDDLNGWSKVTQKKEKKDKKIADEASLKCMQAGQKRGSKVGEKVPVSKGRGSEQQAQRGEQQARNLAHGKLNAKARSAAQKFLCRYMVGIEQLGSLGRSFNVVRKLLGDHGAHMKAIAENTGAKLRIRGRGSGFKEGPDNVEADEPLMICVSATSSNGFEACINDVESLLRHVHDQYYAFCEKRNLPRPNLIVEQTEQPQVHASK